MAGVQTSVPEDFERQLDQHRRALTGYCYRMLGSSFEAEDAVQEAFLRAWRNVDRFEGRSAFKSWLYKIATNVCLDMLDGRKRRARPGGPGPSRSPTRGCSPTTPILLSSRRSARRCGWRSSTRCSTCHPSS